MAKETTRAAVVNLVNSWEGLKESDGSHKKIVDIYNSYKGPFPRGLKMKYNWSWCACTWSALAIKLGYTSIMPIEISCYYLIEAAKKMGIWIEDDAHVPNIGEAVLYYWKDGENFAKTDCTGVPDHVGTVIEVNKSAGMFVVMEGNYSDSVKKRTLSINGRFIRGFIAPKYTSDGVIESKPVVTKSIKTIAREVIAGSWGEGETRKKRIEAAGYDYDAVRKEVNNILNGNTTTLGNNSNKTNVSVKNVIAHDKAQKYNKSIAGTYEVVDVEDYLYVRYGAGTNKKAMAKIPKGTKVKCYGYYSMFNGAKWLYIQVSFDGTTYTGFSSAKYLKKV